MTATGAGTVLIVDDDLDHCRVAERYLAAAGYRVLLASSGLEALDVFAAQEVDLVLLDVLMTSLDGFETCARLRALPRGADTPVLFLTALNDSDSHQRALEVGADDYLTKPIQSVELLLRVRSLVRIKRLITEVCCHRDALLRAQERRQSLTRMIVHDLKGPLQAILGYAELLSAQPDLSPKTDKYSRQIFRAGERMHALVLDVLNTDPSDEVRAPSLKKTLVEVGALLEDVVEASVLLAEASGHTLSVDAQCTTPAIADAGLLRRVLENLVRNAIQHTPPGGVHLVAAQTPSHHTFEVRDTGPGIPPSAREQIFEPRVRLSGAPSERNQGLGLACCRLASQLHGGRMWVEDNHPTGSRFCFSIPIQEPDSTPGEGTCRPDASAGGSGTASPGSASPSAPAPLA